MVLRVMLGEAYQEEVALCSTNPSLYELSLNLYTRKKNPHSIIIKSQQNVLSCISETRWYVASNGSKVHTIYFTRPSSRPQAFPTCAKTARRLLVRSRICHWDPRRSRYSSPRLCYIHSRRPKTGCMWRQHSKFLPSEHVQALSIYSRYWERGSSRWVCECALWLAKTGEDEEVKVWSKSWYYFG